ncbi:MAG: hypothetical protein ACK4N4_00505 [Burkholderiales bacterium]
MNRRWLAAVIGSWALWSASPPLLAQATGDYAEDLARVYGAYQRLIATRDACDEKFPALRSVNARAFGEWKQRHQTLVRDLERRVLVMIRQASADQQEYGRNVGKYEGEILQQRLDYKETLFELDRADLEQQCKKFPAFLKSAEADFRKRYAGELETLARRK